MFEFPLSPFLDHVLFITLDSCRFDTFKTALDLGNLPHLSSVGSLHRAQSPSHFTYGSHASFWMGFTPGLASIKQPFINPKYSKLFKMRSGGHAGQEQSGFLLEGKNIIEGFRRLGYQTFGSGAVEWFNPSSYTGTILGQPFDQFYFPGNTWSLKKQLHWLVHQFDLSDPSLPKFVFLNVGETHVPYWHEGAHWPRKPSPCQAFGGPECDRHASAYRQLTCLSWVDHMLESLLHSFQDYTIIVCADHGDCWGEDGLWEHGISHPMTLNVPLLIRFKGHPQ